ncbi:MAG: nitrilase family protein, partial [Maribacter sp.]
SQLICENPEENRFVFSKKIKAVSKDVDVIVLPEMFTTGFTMSPENIKEEEGPNTIQWMKKKAAETGAALVGSIVFRDGNKHYNRLCFVKPDGELFSYDKRHTFTLAGEHEKYTSGNKLTLVTYKGFAFCPLICYDLRFPVWSRNTDNYDIVLYVANWPEPRINAWDTLLEARAIENMSYSIGVNRIGLDANKHNYCGHSSAYDALGNKLAFSDKEEIIELVVSKAHIIETRNKLSFLNDRDQFNLIY